MNARETAVFWIEYVIRHYGAPHLQTQAKFQNFWQRNSLDVIGFYLICLLTILKMCKFFRKKIAKMILADLLKGKERKVSEKKLK